MIKEQRISSIEEILDYIKGSNTQRSYFDKNGNRDIYQKFREDENLRAFHTQIHYFLALHLPVTLKAEAEKKEVTSEPKSCLKQKTYDLNIQNAKNKCELNFFSLAKAPRRQK